MTNMEKTAAYCEGFLAYQTRKECRYTPDQPELRTEWATGFCAAVAEDRESKVWYKSKTIWAGIVCLVASIVVAVYGLAASNNGPAGMMMAGAGSGMGASSLIFTALRLITKEPVSFNGSGSGYGNQSWGN